MEVRIIALSKIKSLPHALSVIEELLPSLIQFQERIAALEAENKRLKELIPYQRTTALFADVFGQPLSQGTLLNANRECFERLGGCETRTKQETQ